MTEVPTCQRDGCANPAEWVPVLVLRWPAFESATAALSYGGPGPEPVRAVLDVPVCTPCRDRMTLADLLLLEGWASVLQTYEMLNRPAPDPELTVFEWISAGGREHRMFHVQQVQARARRQ